MANDEQLLFPGKPFEDWRQMCSSPVKKNREGGYAHFPGTADPAVGHLRCRDCVYARRLGPRTWKCAKAAQLLGLPIKQVEKIDDLARACKYVERKEGGT